MELVKPNFLVIWKLFKTAQHQKIFRGLLSGIKLVLLNNYNMSSAFFSQTHILSSPKAAMRLWKFNMNENMAKGWQIKNSVIFQVFPLLKCYF